MLAVKRPELLEASAFGDLREDNLQLIIVAESKMRTQTTTFEEDVHIPVVEERDPWVLPQSIFKPRAKEADARAYYDGAAVRCTT